MKRLLLFFAISFLLSGCVNSATKKDFDTEIEKMAAEYEKPAAISENDWVTESREKAKREIAASKTAKPEFLEILAAETSVNIRARVAKNPRTPEATLREFLKSDEVTIRNYLAANTALPEDMLDTLSQDEFPDVRQAAAFNPSNTVHNLKTFADDENQNVQQLLARNPKLPEEVMLLMVEKSTINALGALLQRSDLPEAVLEKLKNHPEKKIQELAAQYGKTPAEQQ